MNPIVNFFRETKTELKKVNWPTREETTRYTLVVIGVSVVVMLFLGGLDYFFEFLLNSYLFK